MLFMLKISSKLRKFRFLALSMVVLPAFGFLLWRSIPTADTFAPVAQAIMGTSIPINVPLSVLKAALDKTSIADPAPTDVPKNVPVEAPTDAPKNVPVEAPTDAPKDTPRILPETGSVPAANTVGAAENTGTPIRIKIPAIAVDAAIEKVALTASASLDIPKNPLDTGWYDLGPRPGETGSAVMDGHVDWYNGATAVFANLDKLIPGDTITIQDEDGSTVNFLVSEIRRYDPATEATDVFVSNDGKAHLNLITCDGVWDKKTQQYSQRLVVFADKN
jgi:LPXTG-site transpeptidase (sortase) family protein